MANHGGKRPGAGRPRTNPRHIEPTGGLNTENLDGLPLNQAWQSTLNQMVAEGVAAPDAVETMLSTALGNMCSIYGHQKVVAALLPVIHGIARAALEAPRTH